MNAYQRRKAEIAYLVQRSERMEKLVVELAATLIKAGLPVPLIGEGITGDAPLDDISSGQFGMRVYTAAHAAANS